MEELIEPNGDGEEEMEEEDHVEQEYNSELTTEHSYLGPDLEEVHGR